jgi:hypothetical protein
MLTLVVSMNKTRGCKKFCVNNRALCVIYGKRGSPMFVDHRCATVPAKIGIVPKARENYRMSTQAWTWHPIVIVSTTETR